MGKKKKCGLGHQRDKDEVFGWIVRKRLKRVRINRERKRWPQEQRISIRCGASGCLRSDNIRPTGPIFYNNLLSKGVRQTFGNDTTENIRGGACRKCIYQLNRSCG